MPAPDDPGAPGEGRRRTGLVIGALITALAVAAAIAFGLARTDDPGRIPSAVVARQDLGPTSGPPVPLPDADVPRGFSAIAAGAGWRPTGGRIDSVEGRRVVTAFWERAGRRIAHSVVSGDPVSAPPGARRTGRRGVLLRSFDRAGRRAVVWREGDHTAVISAIGISRPALYALAGGPVK